MEAESPPRPLGRPTSAKDYSWVYGGKLKPGMLVLDIRGRARNGSVPEGVGVVEEITGITPASNSGGKEYVKLHLKGVKSDKARTRFTLKSKLFEAKDKVWEPHTHGAFSGSGH